MLLPWLMRLIETHAEELTDQLIRAVRTSPQTTFMHDLPEAELRERVFDLYHNLGRWLGEKGEAEIEATYREIGQRRFREAVPLSELVYALLLVKRHLWDYVQKNDLPESAANLYGEEQLVVMVGRFFDTAVYHAVRGYEEDWSRGAALGLARAVPAEADAKGVTTKLTRAVLAELEARRGVLDNDLSLRSVTLTINLEPAGRVRSVTVQQESETTKWRG
jgi:hypothetical protein